MSTWLAGKNTLTPMSTNKPPLILRVTVPVTTCPSLTEFMTLSHSISFCALRRLKLTIPNGSSVGANSSSTSSTNTLTMSPMAGGSSCSSHSFRGIEPSLLNPTSTSTVSSSMRITRPSMILLISKPAIGVDQIDHRGGIFDVRYRRVEEVVNLVVALQISDQITVNHCFTQNR